MSFAQHPAKERLARIFQFLRAFNDQHHPAPRRLSEQPWRLDLSELPRHPSITYKGAKPTRRRSAPAAAEPAHEKRKSPPEAAPLDEDVILAVSRPGISDAPAPPTSLQAWLAPHWEDPFRPAELLPTGDARPRANGTAGQRFEDEPLRVQDYEAWRKARDAWALREQPARLALKVFEELYALYALMEREGERHEIIFGDGLLCWHHKDGNVEHPILLQRLQIEFNPDIPEFRLRESAHPPEVYSGLFSSLTEIDGRALARIRDRFSTTPCHPLGGTETADFLGFLAVQLSPRGRLVSTRPPVPPEDPLITRCPVLFQRTRTLGYGTAIEAILEDLDGEGLSTLSPALARVVGVDPPLPSIGAEPEVALVSEQILLSKPANLEQIRIAERLEKYGAVLVQGPPGTGKTHTIANLIGHLLAQGKTVLVTADTTKALRVVRDQVEEKLRPLCVSVLDNDLEGRRQLEEAVRVIADEISHADVDALTRAAEGKAHLRTERLRALERAERELYEARADEYRAISVNGEEISPAEAARRVARDASLHGWIPPPTRGGECPLRPEELAHLYRTNATVAERDERELREGDLPSPETLPTPDEFESLIETIRSVQPGSLRETPWSRAGTADALEMLEAVSEHVSRAERTARSDGSWHLAVLHAGHKGGANREPWDRLLALVQKTETLVANAQEHFVRHAPYIELLGEERDLLATNTEIEEHVQRGGRLGAFDLLLRPRWREYLAQASVGGHRPETPQHFEALSHLLRLREARRDLAMRWDRLVRAAGGPAATELGTEIEVSAKQFTGPMTSWLNWHDECYLPLQESLSRLGVAWDVILHQQPLCAGSQGEVQRILDALHGPLRAELKARLEALRADHAAQRLKAAAETLVHGDAPLSAALREAMVMRDCEGYRAAFERLLELWRLREDVVQRTELLHRLHEVAPAWASAIAKRSRAHGTGKIPGDPSAAWDWIQIAEELDRRASRSLAELQTTRKGCAEELYQATSDLIEARAWLAQRRRMTLGQQQALTGWLDTQRAMGKGTGKKVPEMKAEARRLMSRCQTAVPVWIMPLSRLVESFDPRHVRFDVVIIDEASQCDLFALVALYLGKRAVVVGDHEQVSPSAVGESVEASVQLITQHLRDIPNAHLYNGKLSVYDLARQSFGGMLALREHFRSVPHIIEFSNQLSYLGRIQPLRDESMVELEPTTIAFRVASANATDKVNRTEAEAVTALLVAATEQEEYARSTFGVISLVGQEQAYEIEGLLRRYLLPKEFERRRIVCGNAAHFQGDERDVMFLSLVDVATDGRLPLRDQQSFKQRFNVAASRARNQMWVVHSLDPHADLKPEDLRRRLILHATHSDAARPHPHGTAAQPLSDLERLVLDRLVQGGFDAQAKWPVGDYRIDIVVRNGRKNRVAITCDGDGMRSIDALREDIARQAVLERLGWKFVRIRGSELFRNPDGAMNAVFTQLAQEGIEPSVRSNDAKAGGLAERVMTRARVLLETRFAGVSPRSVRISGDGSAQLPLRRLKVAREERT